MMRALTKYAIQNPYVTYAFLAVILLVGYLSYWELPKADDPAFVMRIAQVSTFFPGASAKRVENLVTDPIEEIIQEIPELEFIESISRTGQSFIAVKVDEKHFNVRPIWDSLRRKVERASQKLPEGVTGPFVDDELDHVFGTIITITGDGFSYKELEDIAEKVREKILLLQNVGKVSYLGVQEERIFIEYHDVRLAQLGTSATQLRELMESRNIVTPGGSVKTSKERIILEPTGNFDTIEELENTVVQIPGQDQVIYLKDLVNIKRGYVDPPESILHSSGKPSIGLGISMKEGGNIIDLHNSVEGVVQKMQLSYPIGVEFDTIAALGIEAERKVNAFLLSLGQAIIIVMIIMFFALGFRVGWVVATLIPMTISMTLILMRLSGVGIDQISLAALIIALGMLVDNAIVMVESIILEVDSGKTPLEAAITATDELRLPLLTSSLTTSAAFLPIFLAESIAGEYTKSLFLVVTYALLSSWLLSMTMIPMICLNFLNLRDQKTILSEEESWGKYYIDKLTWVLKRPNKVLICFVVMFFISVAALFLVPHSFFPPSDRATFSIDLELPVSTKIQYTTEVVKDIEEFINANLLESEKDEGITNWATFIGGDAPRYIMNYLTSLPSPDRVVFIINTTSKDVQENVMNVLEHYIKEKFPNAITVFKPIDTGPPVPAPVAVRISGDDPDVLVRLANELKSELQNYPHLKTVSDDWGLKSKKVVVEIDQEKALRTGITSRDVAVSLQTILSGFQPTHFREEDKQIPVILRSIEKDRENIDKLKTINVYSQSTTKKVPLRQIADLKLTWEPAKINRRDLVRTITVKASVDKKKITPVNAAIELQPLLEKLQKNWPEEYTYEFGGELETSRQSEKSIAAKVPYGIIIIILLLVVQFRGYRMPLIILMTIPLGIIGVSAGLVITQTEFGFMVFLGLISLSGIVINDAIVLLDRIRIEHKMGKSPQDALLSASKRRLIPIILTTVTTVGGLTPLWLGPSKMFQLMSVAIIFGLVFATILILVFVPVMYSLLYRVKFK